MAIPQINKGIVLSNVHTPYISFIVVGLLSSRLRIGQDKENRLEVRSKHLLISTHHIQMCESVREKLNIPYLFPFWKLEILDVS
jgi:hypothetical protein